MLRPRSLARLIETSRGQDGFRAAFDGLVSSAAGAQTTGAGNVLTARHIRAAVALLDAYRVPPGCDGRYVILWSSPPCHSGHRRIDSSGR